MTYFPVMSAAVIIVPPVKIEFRFPSEDSGFVFPNEDTGSVFPSEDTGFVFPQWR